MKSESHWQAAAELARSGTPFVVITLTHARGHAPQDPGAKAIVTAHGLHSGTVGGGKVEAKAIAQAQAMPAGAAPESHTWNLQRDVGMTCGGEVTLLFERHDPVAWQVHVFGAGHVSQALTRLLTTLNCRVTCYDPRSEWIERLPAGVERRICAEGYGDAEALVAGLPEEGYFVVMTQGHATDMPVLRALFADRPHARYVGVIGSEVKALKIRAELKELGYAPDRVARLRCPMGLRLGTNDPAEIALSIAAELIQVRDTPRCPTPFFAPPRHKG